ncbi:Transcriptional regulator, MecI family [hydrothermal vent metagenome]|uniref:Transcriptional regulator, MecI family n=1 Tax=hydrothermal vent metagenome TaxID=652676 RepID=A0A3B0U9Q6_9ZZZZ
MLNNYFYSCITIFLVYIRKALGIEATSFLFCEIKRYSEKPDVSLAKRNAQNKIKMDKLTNKEQEIMQVLWKLKKAFVKEVVAELPKPKPHYNTVSTVIRKMEDKGYVKHETFGKTHRYFPIVSKENYRKNYFLDATQNYFENSYKNVVSFFAQEEKISADELREIIKLIENKK